MKHCIFENLDTNAIARIIMLLLAVTTEGPSVYAIHFKNHIDTWNSLIQ